MDSWKDQQYGQNMRQLARQYAEGRFNKAQYRHLRRELIARCSGEMPANQSSTGEADADFPALQKNRQRIPWPRLLGFTGASLVVLVIGLWVYLQG